MPALCLFSAPRPGLRCCNTPCTSGSAPLEVVNCSESLPYYLVVEKLISPDRCRMGYEQTRTCHEPSKPACQAIGCNNVQHRYFRPTCKSPTKQQPQTTTCRDATIHNPKRTCNQQPPNATECHTDGADRASLGMAVTALPAPQLPPEHDIKCMSHLFDKQPKISNGPKHQCLHKPADHR
jgi:hypothetical protein